MRSRQLWPKIVGRDDHAASERVDWDSAESKAQATQWFRQAIFEYVRDYAARGNDALMVFNDKKAPNRLADEHRELLDESLFVNEIAPEFARYLGNYPRLSLPGVEENLTWSEITFGFKPTLTVTQVLLYSHDDPASRQYLMATKQIYGSHYIDSSLAFSMLVNVTAADATNTYLIFTNLSRSDSFTGVLGGVKRSLVGAEAIQHVKEILKVAKSRLETNGDVLQASDAEAEKPGGMDQIRVLSHNPIIQGLLVFFVVGLMFGIYTFARRFRS